MSILQNIFADHFHKLLNSNIKIRDTVIENVDKMIHCGDYKRGYAFYFCEHCSHFMVSPFRCRSRFCPSCGNLYSRKRSTAMSFKLVHTSHRHCMNSFVNLFVFLYWIILKMILANLLKKLNLTYINIALMVSMYMLSLLLLTIRMF